ncbi:MAG: polyphosphate kinase 1, partial [Oscillospiraceae bacterium]
MPEPANNDIFLNRELSWLEFNNRVLDLAKEKGVPLGEQLRFAAIYNSNLDEFFMIRVGSLYDQTLLKSEKKENKTGMTPKQQLAAIMPKAGQIQKVCDKIVLRLYEKLKKYQIEKVDFSSLEKEDEEFWRQYFLKELSPVLSPQIIDRRHPFPFLRNGELYIGAMLKTSKTSRPAFGLLPISTQYERVITVTVNGVTRFALVEELALHFAPLVFGKTTVVSKSLFRVTRNADIDAEEGMFDHDIDYRVVMSELLKKRRKLAAVRLQFWGRPPVGIRNFLMQKLMLPAEQCYIQRAPLELSFLFRLSSRLKNAGLPELFYPICKPILPPQGTSLYG